jgi:hypothetical protein
MFSTSYMSVEHLKNGCSDQSSLDTNVVTEFQISIRLVLWLCLGPKGGTEAQEPAARPARSSLQARCRVLDAIRSGTRYAKWAGGSRSQTHRRAAMGGFTQDDGYVRGLAPTHDCSSGSFSNLCNLWRLWPVLELST